MGRDTLGSIPKLRCTSAIISLVIMAASVGDAHTGLCVCLYHSEQSTIRQGVNMAILGTNKLYPKPVEGETIEIEPITLMQATKYWDAKANRRVIVQGWDGHRLDLPEHEEIYQIFAWNVTYNIPAIIDMPKAILEEYSTVSRLQKQHGGKILFTRIRKNGKLVPHFEHVKGE